jgi:hypothetical protein
MKNKPIRICCFLLFFIVYLLLMPGCKKNISSDGNGNNNPLPGGSSCTAARADAENIQVFPADKRAMKKYGLILADIGSDLFISGAPDERWNNDDLHQPGQVHGSDFEVVKFN